MALEARQVAESGNDAAVEAVEEEGHAAEVVGLLAREVGLESRDAGVHDPRAAAQQVVCHRALVDVPRRQQRQRGLAGADLRAGPVRVTACMCMRSGLRWARRACMHGVQGHVLLRAVGGVRGVVRVVTPAQRHSYGRHRDRTWLDRATGLEEEDPWQRI